MNRTYFIISAMLAALGASLWQITRDETIGGSSPAPLLVHCAAGLREPVTEIARLYEQEFEVPVLLQFGGSGALETQLQLAGGDIFLPADGLYIDSARAKGLVREHIPVTTFTAGIVVPAGNPKNLSDLESLTRPGVRLSLAERSAAIGRHTWDILEETGKLPQIQPNVVVTKPTVNNIIEDVATGAVDATIAWDSVSRSFPELEWIPVSVFSANPRPTSLGILSASTRPTRALHFARFLTAHDRGLKTFTQAGFIAPENSDIWANTPEIKLSASTALPPAIQNKIRSFESREGCRINVTVKNRADSPTPSITVPRGTSHPRLIARLGIHLGTTNSHAPGEALGFTWKFEPICD